MTSYDRYGDEIQKHKTTWPSPAGYYAAKLVGPIDLDFGFACPDLAGLYDIYVL